MRFSLGGLQALSLIYTDPPRLVTGNFSAANIKLTGQALSLMTSKMGDAAIDLATGAKTVKELWSRLLTQYHEKGWGAESILFQKLVYLKHSDCENTGDYIGKLRGMSQCLANMGRVCPNWVLVYLLISGLGDEHHSWATSFRNASRKEPDLPLLDVVTSQLLDESRLTNKSGASDSGMALFSSTSKKRKLYPTYSTSIQGKSTYNKATAKCTHCKKSYHEAVDCWILHPELARPGWVPPVGNKSVSATTQNDPNSINFMSVYANSAVNPWANMSHESNTCDESMLCHEMSSYLSNSLVETENNDFNFDKFIKDCEAISHKSSQDVYKEFSDVGDFPCPYDADEYVIEQTPEKIQEKLQTSSPHAYISPTETMVRRNDNEQDKNDQSYAHSDIFEPISAAVNMPSPVPLAEFADPNWHISFMNMMEKNVLQAHLTMISTKTLRTSKTFEYLKNLWHIDSGATNHIYISRQCFSDYYPIQEQENIWTGLGSVAAIEIGTVRMELKKFDGSNSFITIYNVLHILIFMKNLISVSLLRKKGIYW